MTLVPDANSAARIHQFGTPERSHARFGSFAEPLGSPPEMTTGGANGSDPGGVHPTELLEQETLVLKPV